MKRALNFMNKTPLVVIPAPISHWKVDSNTIDSMGLNNGTATSITYTAGKIGDCAVFNGTSSIVIGTQSVYAINSGTIACWVKTASAGSSFRAIFLKTLGYNLFAIDGVIASYSWTAPSGIKSSGVNINDNNWHHIVRVFESGGTSDKIYIDGILRVTFSTGIFNAGSTLELGKSGGSQYFNGKIDMASIWAERLSDAQVLAVYNLQNSGTDIV